MKFRGDDGNAFVLLDRSVDGDQNIFHLPVILGERTFRGQGSGPRFHQLARLDYIHHRFLIQQNR